MRFVLLVYARDLGKAVAMVGYLRNKSFMVRRVMILGVWIHGVSRGTQMLN